MKVCSECNKVRLIWTERQEKGICVGCEVASPRSLAVVYTFIKNHIRWYHIGPTHREIGERLNLTIDQVRYHLNEMERRGWLAREKYRQRVFILKGMK